MIRNSSLMSIGKGKVKDIFGIRSGRVTGREEAKAQNIIGETL